MANWCSNTVEFTGSVEKIKQCAKFIEKMIQEAERSNIAVKHPLIHQAIDGYYFELYCPEFEEQDITVKDYSDTSITIHFESRWGPIPNDVVYLAITVGVDFVYSYEESGNLLYGEYLFQDNVLSIREVTNDEYESCFYLEKENDDFELTNYEMLEDILKDKIYETIKYELPQKINA